MTELPPSDLFDAKGHYPHRHRIETEHVIRRRGLIDVTVRVISNWPRKQWWLIGLDGSGFRPCNTLRTSSKRIVEQWIADVKAGRVKIGVQHES